MQRRADWIRGRLGKSGSVASKIKLFFSPAMPERLRRKKGEYFRWVLTVLSVTVKGEGKKWFTDVLSYLWRNSKDDANHL